MKDQVFRYNTGVSRDHHGALCEMLGRGKSPKVRRRVLSTLYRMAEDVLTEGAGKVPISLPADSGSSELDESLSVYIHRDTYPVLFAFVRSQRGRKAGPLLLDLLNHVAGVYIKEPAVAIGQLSEKARLEALVRKAELSGEVQHIEVHAPPTEEDDKEFLESLLSWGDEPEATGFSETGADPGNLG